MPGAPDLRSSVSWELDHDDFCDYCLNAIKYEPGYLNTPYQTRRELREAILSGQWRDEYSWLPLDEMPKEMWCERPRGGQKRRRRIRGSRGHGRGPDKKPRHRSCRRCEYEASETTPPSSKERVISEQVDTLKMIHGIPTWSKEDGEDPDMRWVQDRDGQLRCAGKAPSKEELLRLRALKPSLFENSRHSQNPRRTRDPRVILPLCFDPLYGLPSAEEPSNPNIIDGIDHTIDEDLIAPKSLLPHKHHTRYQARMQAVGSI